MMENLQALLLQTEKGQYDKCRQEAEEAERRQKEERRQEREEAEKWQDEKRRQEREKAKEHQKALMVETEAVSYTHLTLTNTCS